MARIEPNKVTEVAIVGTGLIGAGWAALFLARGLKVHAIDPAQNAEVRLHDTIRSMWGSLRELGAHRNQHLRLMHLAFPPSPPQN